MTIATIAVIIVAVSFSVALLYGAYQLTVTD